MKIVISTLVALMVATSSMAHAASTAPTEIATTGTANISIMPDQAVVNASIVTNAPDASSAVSQSSTIYSAVVASLAKLGIARDDVTLSYYSVQFVPKPNAGEATPSYQRFGYTVTRAFAIKVRAMNKAGAVVDAATAAGATEINGVSFGIAHDESVRAQAIEKAVADARASAELLAHAAHLHIVGIRRIEYGEPMRPIPMTMRMSAAAAPAPTTFDPGSVHVSANVSIVFLATP